MFKLYVSILSGINKRRKLQLQLNRIPRASHVARALSNSIHFVSGCDFKAINYSRIMLAKDKRKHTKL